MGTTLCCLLFHEKGVVYANVGDSRIYRVHGDTVEQLTGLPVPEPEPPDPIAEMQATIDALLDAAERMRAEQKGDPSGTEPTPGPAGPSSGGPSPAGQPAAAGSGGIGATATPAPAPTPATPAAVDSRLAVSSAPAVEHRTSDSAAARPIYKKWWFWTLIGVGVAATATGIALGVRASSASSDPSNIEIRNVF